MPDIAISLNENEQQVLSTLIDAANRHLGSNAAHAVAHFLGKLADAQNAAAQPKGNVIDLPSGKAAS